MLKHINPQQIWNLPKFVLILFLLTLALTSIGAFIEFKLLKKNLDDIDVDDEKYNISIKTFILSCILGPYIETLLFQTFIFKLTAFFIKDPSLYILVAFTLSTVVFSAVHFSLGNIYDALRRVPLALALALLYVVLLIQDHAITPTNGIFIFHALWNLLFMIIIPTGADFLDKIKVHLENTKLINKP